MLIFKYFSLDEKLKLIYLLNLCIAMCIVCIINGYEEEQKMTAVKSTVTTKIISFKQQQSCLFCQVKYHSINVLLFLELSTFSTSGTSEKVCRKVTLKLKDTSL